MLNVGDKAPDFKLTTLSADGPVHVTLSENAGSNVLLLFVPMAFTGVCTTELCSITSKSCADQAVPAVACVLPSSTAIFNSGPVRDARCAWCCGILQRPGICNRGSCEKTSRICK